MHQDMEHYSSYGLNFEDMAMAQIAFEAGATEKWRDPAMHIEPEQPFRPTEHEVISAQSEIPFPTTNSVTAGMSSKANSL